MISASTNYFSNLKNYECIHISFQYEEIFAPEVNDFVYITDNAYSSVELRNMELDILRTLDFSLGRPLALHFLRRNSKAGEVDSVQHALAKYFMEVTLLVSERFPIRGWRSRSVCPQPLSYS